MSNNKKYYYLKLKDNFFDSDEMKILESQKNGMIYQNLYLKLCLLSLKHEGKLIFKETIPYDLNMLSTILRINIDTVKTGIELLNKLKLIEIMESGIIFLSDIQNFIGHASTESERKAEYRHRIAISRDNVQQMSHQSPGQLPPEIEIELELEKELEIYKESSTEDPCLNLKGNAKQYCNIMRSRCDKNFKFCMEVFQKLQRQAKEKCYNTGIPKINSNAVLNNLIVEELNDPDSWVWSDIKEHRGIIPIR